MRSLLVLAIVALVVCAPAVQAEGTSDSSDAPASETTSSSTTFSGAGGGGPPDPGSSCRPMCF